MTTRNRTSDATSLEGLKPAEVAEEIRKHASEAKNEAELRIRIETLLSPIREKLGIEWASYEYGHTLSGLRKDALYGTVIIEYKSPGKLQSRAEFRKGKEQIKKYIIDEARDPRHYGRFYGVLLDGYSISFIRFRKNEWEDPEEPFEVSARTVMRLLEAIRGLRRKPIDAQLLLKDFGPKSHMSRKMISVLYDALRKPKSPRTEMIFTDWRRVFSQVCEYSPEKLSGLIEYYRLEKDVDVERLMFCIHTYYTVLMKFLTSEIVTLYADSIIGSYLKRLEEAYYESIEHLRNELVELEEGGLFLTVGIRNFLEADYFAWYLDEWTEEIASSVVDMIKLLLDYEPATVELDPDRVKDLFKRLYQNLVPKKVRHDLGEYFTPDWLAELLLNEIDYDGEPSKRLLDPACGSGTFLVLAVRRMKEYAEEHFLDKRDLLKTIVSNIVGIDLNPLAVLASRANYIIALGDLIRYRPKQGFDIPIYLADSVLVSRKMRFTGEREAYITTSEGEFWVPHEVIDKNLLPSVLTQAETCIKGEYSVEEFAERLEREVRHLGEPSYASLVRLYEKIQRLEVDGKDGIWTRLLRNSFAPLLVGKFDYVVGNPPWVNWEHLPKHYREKTRKLWDRYGLLGAKGGIRRVKKDISMLFTARCLERYVRDNGTLSFLIPFTIFKTHAGAGFRVFLTRGYVKPDGQVMYCKTVRVHDLVELHPFEKATNRTSLIVMARKKGTKFPIPCTMWTNPNRGRIGQESELQEVYDSTRQFDMILVPIERKKPESQWMIISRSAYSPLSRIIGPSDYTAYAGTYTGSDGVFILKEISEPRGNAVLVENIGKTAKKDVKRVKTSVERDLLYPVVRGKDVKKWYSKPSLRMIVPHNPETAKAFPEREMKTNYAEAFAYFRQFKEVLEKRTIKPFLGSKRTRHPFYMLDNMGKRTFSPFKVCWKHISGKISGKAALKAFVLPSEGKNGKNIVTTHGIMFIPIKELDEAHYVCAVLNSSIAALIVSAYGLEVHITTDVPKYVRIPQYDRSDSAKRKLASLSKKAHKVAKGYYEEDDQASREKLEEIEERIDEVVCGLYGLSDDELSEIKKNLKIFREGEVEEK